MVKDFVIGQPPCEALTVIVAVIGEDVELVAIKEDIVAPLLPPPNPIAVLLFVQVNAVPGVVLVDVYGPAVPPAQTVSLEGTVNVGGGAIVKLFDVVVVPHSFVTANVIVFVPVVLNVIGPGSAFGDVVPPGKVHK